MSRSEFQFRFADAQDHAALADLVLEANRHYWGQTENDVEMASKTAEALVAGRSGCQAILALVADTPKGFATISILHPAPNENGTLFMKDMYVAKSARGSGLGRQFMHYLARHAVELGCHRFDWTAETGNAGAIAFYRDLAASQVEEKVYFRFSGEGLREFARQ